MGGPFSGEVRQLLLAGEYFALEIRLLAAEGCNAVLFVDRIGCHCAFPFVPLVAVMTFITPKPGNKQVNSAGRPKKKSRREIGRAVAQGKRYSEQLISVHPY